jgi:hypothetical protein
MKRRKETYAEQEKRHSEWLRNTPNPEGWSHSHEPPPGVSWSTWSFAKKSWLRDGPEWAQYLMDGGFEKTGRVFRPRDDGSFRPANWNKPPKSQLEIKRSFHKEFLATHPDKNPGIDPQLFKDAYARYEKALSKSSRVYGPYF